MPTKPFNSTINLTEDYSMIANTGNIVLTDGGNNINGKYCDLRIPQEDGRTLTLPITWVQISSSIDFDTSLDNDLYLFRLFNTTYYAISTNTEVVLTAPTLSAFAIETTTPTRVNFNSSRPITGSTFSGFSVTDKTVTAIHIESGATTGHYLTVNSVFAETVSPTISYDGSNDIKGQLAKPISLQAFSGVAITNNIDGPDITAASVENAAPSNFVFTAERAITGTTAGWTPKINGVAATKTGFAGSGTTTITITVSETVVEADVLTLDYSGGDMADQYGNVMQAISGQSVTNNVASFSPADLSPNYFDSTLRTFTGSNFVDSGIYNAPFRTAYTYIFIKFNATDGQPPAITVLFGGRDGTVTSANQVRIGTDGKLTYFANNTSYTSTASLFANGQTGDQIIRLDLTATTCDIYLNGTHIEQLAITQSTANTTVTLYDGANNANGTANQHFTGTRKAIFIKGAASQLTAGNLSDLTSWFNAI